MPLLIHIKPGESLFIGMGSITNRSEHRTHLEINGDFPWLHQKEVMQETEATSPTVSHLLWEVEAAVPPDSE
jgi:flagellar biosynthesis regulator FlbT